MNCRTDVVRHFFMSPAAPLNFSFSLTSLASNHTLGGPSFFSGCLLGAAPWSVVTRPTAAPVLGTSCSWLGIKDGVREGVRPTRRTTACPSASMVQGRIGDSTSEGPEDNLKDDALTPRRASHYHLFSRNHKSSAFPAAFFGLSDAFFFISI